MKHLKKILVVIILLGFTACGNSALKPALKESLELYLLEIIKSDSAEINQYLVKHPQKVNVKQMLDRELEHRIYKQKNKKLK
ncbi:MAG: hypothetical protein ACRC6X_08105 [Culicoidibacterales bacterium]